MSSLMIMYLVSYKIIRLLISCFVLLAGSHQVSAQATLHKDLKKDFGAVGDGRINDQPAFARAADFFNRRAQTAAGAGRAILHIPRGTYRVGQPGPGSQPDLLALRGCRNLTIAGEDSATTEIRYADSLRYGTFDPTTHLPYEPPVAFFTAWDWGMRGGIAIVLQNCDNVAVRNLRLNGNSSHLLVGGHWGDTGIQLPADGVFINDSRHIRLQKLAVHHFGRDGAQVLNHLAKSLDAPASENIQLENCRFDYNGRQGLSITGANGLRATNCSFSHTGRVVIAALGRPLYSNPGAGIDIEPEGGYAANIRLDRCRLVDNAGQALVSDRYGSGPPTTHNIVLHDCLLWGVTNWSAWVRQTGFLFENCRIYGAFVTGCAFADHATRFIGCTFEDRAYRGQPAYGQFLLYSNREARAMSFTNCRFVGTRNYLLFATSASADSVSRFRFQSCSFEIDNAEPAIGGSNVLTNSIFKGHIAFRNGRHHADSVRADFLLGSLEAPNSAVVQGESSLLLATPGGRYLLQNGLVIGPVSSRGAASVEVGRGNELVLREQPGHAPELYIGPASRLVIRKGGRLELQPHTKVTVAGKLVIEDGAYFYQAAQAEVQTVGRGQLRSGLRAQQ